MGIHSIRTSRNSDKVDIQRGLVYAYFCDVAAIYSEVSRDGTSRRPPSPVAHDCLLYGHNRVSKSTEYGRGTIIRRLENVYLAGFCILQLTTSVLLPLLASESARTRWEFLPLMATSIYCSLGLIWSWARLVYASAKGVEEHIRCGEKVKAL